MKFLKKQFNNLILFWNVTIFNLKKSLWKKHPAAKVRRNYQYSGLDSVAGLFGTTKRKYN